jgi:valyl-tRNA synthetase
VRIAPLAEAALEAVRDGRVRILPDHFAKVYYNWMENIRDWCISRQLWWGHRIPVWTCPNGHVTASIDDPAQCPSCGSAELTQDPDVLDTWFSSGLWPFSTLGWPDDTPDLRRFYPTSVMETGYDILFFWVARMIMLGLAMMEEVPFRTVYLHGLIRVGREKMSKVKGNVLNPIELIDGYGTDALRLALVSGTTPGNDTQVNPDKLEDNRNFVNKLWNAGRFVMSNVESWPERNLAAPLAPAPGADSEADRWIVSRANAVTAQVSRLLEAFQLGEAAGAARDFLWSEFCDWYVEIAKLELRLAETEAEREAIRANLAWVFEHTLRLLHPMAPFVTEELWQSLVSPRSDGRLPPALVVAPWPSQDGPRDEAAERHTEAFMELARGVRNLRAEYRVDPARWIPAFIVTAQDQDFYRRVAPVLGGLLGCRLQPVTVAQQLDAPAGDYATIVAGGVTLAIPLAGMVDVAEERARLDKERTDTLGEIGRAEALLGKTGFVEKARPDVVQRERDKLAALRERLAKLEHQLAALGGGLSETRSHSAR